MTQSQSPKPQGGAQKPAKAYSCIRCFERKVKCDKESPCSNCSKSGVECVFRVPPAPRRRKKRTQEEILKARLTQYEDILRSKGIDVHKDGVKAEDLPPTSPESLDRTTSNESPSDVPGTLRASGGMMPQRPFVNPRLIVDQGRTRFVENNLWTSMAEEFRKPSDAMPEPSDEEDSDTAVEDNIDFVLGATPSSIGVHDLHPLPEQVFTLWQIFLDNVNPLSKIVHVPSLQPAIIEASSHLDKLPRNFEALLFAIYSTAVLSLEPDECDSMLGEPRVVLLKRYRTGTKRALARAKFLGTSDLMVLQAFVIHLLGMRDTYDAKTLWTLTGVGNRIAEGMGIHRDGLTLGLGYFETEMRRRLWWQLLFLDFRTAELTGAGHYGNLGSWDVRIPSNVNDEDIWPGMKQEPTPKERGTEMIFCLTRYELGSFWKQKLLTKEPSGDFSTLWTNFRRLGSIEEKEKGVEELERTLEHKYVRFCDPSSPVEFMAILVTRAATNGMRLMAHHPRRYAKDEDVPDSERRLLWSIATKLMDIDNLLHSSKQMIHFRWHTDSYFQWQALIYALTELRKRPLHDQADRGWQLVNEIFENHPTFVTEIKRPIHFAVGSLCAKAWKAREDTWSQRSIPIPLNTPDYIKRLQRDREETKTVPTPKPRLPQADYFSQIQANKGAGVDLPVISTASTSLIDDPNQPQVNLPAEGHELHGQQFQYVQQLQQQSLPPQLQFPQQDQQLFWWEFARNDPNGMSQPVDFNMDQLAGDGHEAMDWSQWDFLLKDYRPAG